MKVTLAKKLVCLILFSGLAPLITLGYLGYEKSVAIMTQEIEEDLTTYVTMKSNHINTYFDNCRKDVETLSRNPIIMEVLPELIGTFSSSGPNSKTYASVDDRLRNFLTYHIDSHGYYDLFVISPAGDIVFSVLHADDFGTNLITGPYKETELSKSVDTAATSLETIMSDFKNYAPSEAPAAFVTTPVFNRDGSLGGSLAVQLSAATIYHLISDYRCLGQSGETVLASQVEDYAFIVNPLKMELGAAFSKKIQIGSADGFPIQQAVQGHKGLGRFKDYRGEDVLAAWCYLPHLRLGMVMKQDVAEAYRPIHTLRNQSLAIGVFSIIVLAGVALALSRTISAPVKELTETAGVLASGNFSAQTHIQSNDEIGELGEAFNFMANALKLQQDELVESKEQALQMMKETEEINDHLESATTRANDMATEQIAFTEQLLNLSQTHQDLYRCHSVEEVANSVTTVLVRNFDAYFARIWFIGPNDLCDECALADHCETQESCLHLLASSGKYTHLDGDHRRVPLGAFKIGKIAEGQEKVYSNDVVNDERIHHNDWAEKLGLQSFAGLPLLKNGKTIGVMAMFSKHELPDYRLDIIEILAQITSSALANIEQIKTLEERQIKLSHDAFHDQLTNLSNRVMLNDRLERTIDRAGRHQGGLFALLYLDLDRFKDINDSMGHPQGDALLIEVAKRLKSCVRSCDTVARMGGDEFAILLESIEDFSEAIRVAERIHECLAVPVQLEQKDVPVSTSIGITISATGQVTPEELLRDADTALYRAKGKGKNCYEIFDVTMHEQVQNRLELEEGLQAAIKNEEFVLHYQPLVSLETGYIQGYEALLRWDHPREGLVYPDKFIPLAEETGLIIPLGKWITRQACQQLKAWQDQFVEHRDLSMNINLSVKQLASPDIADEIATICQETGVSPKHLNLEITESLLMNDIDYARDVLTKLKLLGTQLDLDDFGTGFSSLSILHQLPFDRLKIDRSFVSRMTNDAASSEMVRTITTLAQNLKLEIVAEGIESVDQLRQLEELKCEFGQGYHFSPPLPAAAAQELLVQEQLRREGALAPVSD